MRARCLILCLMMVVIHGCATVKQEPSPIRGLLQKTPDQCQWILTDLKPQAIHPSVVRPETVKPNVQKPNVGFIWPVKTGMVSSYFGDRSRDYHEGIDIHTRQGTPIYASNDGTVIYSSQQIGGYGNMIVLKHSDGMATVYAHNQKNLVTRGMDITQGQLIAFVGATGKATGPHLHFEIRKHELAQNPLEYLPKIHKMNAGIRLRHARQVSSH